MLIWAEAHDDVYEHAKKLQYTYDFAMQISFFLDMPLAVFMVEPGSCLNPAAAGVGAGEGVRVRARAGVGAE